MKKTFRLLIIAVLPMLAACHRAQVPVSGVSVMPFSVQMEVGDTRYLTATVKPDNAADKTIRWETSDASVVSVNNGVITALSPGNAVVRAVAVVGGKSGTCDVTVIESQTPPEPPGPAEIPAESVTLDIEELILPKEGTAHLSASVLPLDTTDELKWSSSDPAVVSVDDKGNITAIAGGQATITATAGSVSARAEICVEIPVLYYEFVDQDVELAIGQTFQERLATKPSDATPRDVVTEWGVKHPGRPSIGVDENGLVTAIDTGVSYCTCTVTYTTYDFDKQSYVRHESPCVAEFTVFLDSGGSHEGFDGEDWD